MDRISHAAEPSGIAELIEKMAQDGLPAEAIDVFSHYYDQIKKGRPATIPESEIVPLCASDISDHSSLERYASQGREALQKTAILKLNGGLGTTMGLAGPKSLIPIKNGHTFLDLSLSQVTLINQRLGTTVPFVLMSSFFTEAATRAKLTQSPEAGPEILHHFLQHRFPKIFASTHKAVSYPADPQLEWYPAGHGDLLLSLASSGTLSRLLDHGYRYLFVSNIDNLGATIELSILGFFSVEKLDVLMEVTDRTAMDRKGGHLARLKRDNRLILRESAQCDEQDKPFFSDITRHPFFNTNNIWLNLESVDRALQEKKHLSLPLVINRKMLNPVDPASPEIIQLESAIGSAISIFEKSGAVRVPRSRFAPVKNCEELLLVWSDYFQLTDDGGIRVNPARKTGKVILSLDPRFYSRVDFLQERFPYGAPSLVECDSLTIQGDVKFGRDVRIAGAVTISNGSSEQITINHHRVIDRDLTV